ncbi:MAG: hypothetical protein SGPRY_008240, partial [Prymnesium sp.]
MCGWCFQEEVAKEDFKPTCEFIKKVLGKAVDKVDVSSRLTSSPSALVQPQWGIALGKAAAAGTEDMMGGMAANLEINPKHPVVSKLKAMVDADRANSGAEQFAKLLHEVAVVSSGYEIEDPAAFAKRITALMADGEAGLADLESASNPQPPPSPPSAMEEKLTTDVEIKEGKTDVEFQFPEDEKPAQKDEDKPINPE